MTDLRPSIVGIALHPNLVEKNKRLSGTGFVARHVADGLCLVTCKHVTDKAQRDGARVAFYLELEPTTLRWAEVIYTDHPSDLAILRPLIARAHPPARLHHRP